MRCDAYTVRIYNIITKGNKLCEKCSNASNLLIVLFLFGCARTSSRDVNPEPGAGPNGGGGSLGTG